MLDWRRDENFARIGRNIEIRDLLGLIKNRRSSCVRFHPRYSDFDADFARSVSDDRSFDLGKDDNVFRCLVATQECKVPSLPSHSYEYFYPAPENWGGGGGGVYRDVCYCKAVLLFGESLSVNARNPLYHARKHSHHSEKYYSSHSKKHPHHAEGRCGEEIWERIFETAILCSDFPLTINKC